MKRPIAVPAPLLAMLAEDSEVKDTLGSEGLSADKLPQNWFLASEIHLNGPQEKDLLIVGKGLLMGANVTRFWLFRNQQNKSALLLKTIGHDLILKDTRSGGYRDIEVLSLVANRIAKVDYKFDGRTYIRRAGSSTKIP